MLKVRTNGVPGEGGKPFAIYHGNQRASDDATSGGWVKGVYLNALEYTSSPKGTRGTAFLLGGVGTAVVSGFAAYSGLGFFDVASPGWFDYLFVLPSSLAFLYVGFWALRFFGRMEFFRPQDLPIIFDRKRRKVYRLIESRELDTRGKPHVKVLEHDWDDIVAEHHVVTLATGSSAQRHHSLVLMVRGEGVLKEPGGNVEDSIIYVDGFGLGDAKVLSEFSVPRVWEHVRRYMNEGGPALPSGEAIADSMLPNSWWDSLGAVSVFGSGYLIRWSQQPFMMLLIHALLPLFLPLAILMASANWLSYKTSYSVQWPQDILKEL